MKEEIKELRKIKEMTQKEFSQYLNIPLPTIIQWENNKRKPPNYVIELIRFKVKNDNYQLRMEI